MASEQERLFESEEVWPKLDLLAVLRIPFWAAASLLWGYWAADSFVDALRGEAVIVSLGFGFLAFLFAVTGFVETRKSVRYVRDPAARLAAQKDRERRLEIYRQTEARLTATERRRRLQRAAGIVLVVATVCLAVAISTPAGGDEAGPFYDAARSVAMGAGSVGIVLAGGFLLLSVLMVRPKVDEVEGVAARVMD